MNIIIDPIDIKINGDVELDVFDRNRNTKQHQEFTNTIHADLKGAIATTMQGNSGSVAITSANKFTVAYPHATSQASKSGILKTQSGKESAGTTVGDETADRNWDFLLKDNEGISTSGNAITWTAESTWLGTKGVGTATSGAFDVMKIGYNYNYHDQSGWVTNAFLTGLHFDTIFATANADTDSDFTAFSLDDNDIARVTWTITIS